MAHYIQYWRNDLPKCPHCDADFEVWSGDNPLDINYEDGGSTKLECESCHQGFVCVTAVEYKFSTAVSEDAASDEEWGPTEAVEAGE